MVLMSLIIIAKVEVPGIDKLIVAKPLRIFRLFKRIHCLRRLMSSLVAAVPGVLTSFSVFMIVMLIGANMSVTLSVSSNEQVCSDNFSDLTSGPFLVGGLQ